MKGLSTMEDFFKFKTLYEFGAEQDDQAKDILKLAGWKIHRDESQKIYYLIHNGSGQIIHFRWLDSLMTIVHSKKCKDAIIFR